MRVLKIYKRRTHSLGLDVKEQSVTTARAGVLFRIQISDHTHPTHLYINYYIH